MKGRKIMLSTPGRGKKRKTQYIPWMRGKEGGEIGRGKRIRPINLLRKEKEEKKKTVAQLLTGKGGKGKNQGKKRDGTISFERKGKKKK